MKPLKTMMFAFFLSLHLALPAVAEPGVVTLDENGTASWDEVDGATGYEYDIVDADYVAYGETQYVSEPCAQVPEGFSIHVRAVLENGEYGDWMISDYYGEAVIYVDSEETELFDENENEAEAEVLEGDADEEGRYEENEIDPEYTTKWNDLLMQDVIAQIDPDTVNTAADGTISFETVLANGQTVRLEGTGVTFEEGRLIFAPGGQITSLDSIGRICASDVDIIDANEMDEIYFYGGYTFTDEESVDSGEDLFFHQKEYVSPASVYMGEGHTIFQDLKFQPNFMVIGAEETNEREIVLSSWKIYYDETTFQTGIRKMELWAEMYGAYIDGERYDASKELFDEEQEIYDFYLMIQPELADKRNAGVWQEDPNSEEFLYNSIIAVPSSKYTIGDLKDADGTVLDKETASVTKGSTIEVTVGEYTQEIELPVIEYYTGGQTLHELAPYNNASAQGAVTSLVIPVYWQDQPENATDEFLHTLKCRLGQIVDAEGQMVDYSQENENFFSLSEYYDTVSYHQYEIRSFVTDWYAAAHDFKNGTELQSVSTDCLIVQEIYNWLLETYPDMDWSQFDADGDGFLDSVIIVNAGETGDSVMMGTFSYAMFISDGYTGENRGTQEQPALKNFISMNMAFLDNNTLIHEYAHSFGLVDYYDVTYTGIDAVGRYDMQSQNVGDWNAYSKYAVGWIQPEVVTNLAPGQSVELTIGEFGKTGEAIVIPAAEHSLDGPFNEYILIDLFTDGGVNQYDAAEYGLEGAHGVRISHVDSLMEKRILNGTDGEKYPIGTIRYSNSYNEEGTYLLEVIQAGGSNTFTNLDHLQPNLSKEDLFEAGDFFCAEDYTEFFADGLMDDGSAFGYTVEIVSIDQDSEGIYSATIRITRQEK